MPDPSHDVAAAYRRLAELGLILGAAGNISVRRGNEMWITPSSIPAADVDADSICRFDLPPTEFSMTDRTTGEGSASPPRISTQPDAVPQGSSPRRRQQYGQTAGPRPSSEWLLHVRTYGATDAVAIVHTHSLAATAVTLVADELPAVHYYLVQLGSGPVPVVPYATYGSEQLADSVASALGDGRRAVLLQNHGAVVTGDTLGAAMDRAELLEWLSDLYLRAASVAAPRTLGAADLDAVTEQAAIIEARGYCC